MTGESISFYPSALRQSSVQAWLPSPYDEIRVFPSIILPPSQKLRRASRTGFVRDKQDRLCVLYMKKGMSNDEGKKGVNINEPRPQVSGLNVKSINELMV